MKRTKDEIIITLNQCIKTIECAGCLYTDYTACKTVLLRDAAGLIEELDKKIEELEERIAIMTEGCCIK